MDEKYCEAVRRAYERCQGDATGLFQVILSIAGQVGLADALACLERCVIEKRLAWWARNAEALPRTGNPLHDGYRIFYELYLGLSTPQDGEIVEASDSRLVTRWWNRCPTLEACQKLGLDTREVCQRAYHAPVQALLSRIDPRLRFERNYDALRPHAPYCEEIIRLKDPKGFGNPSGLLTRITLPTPRPGSPT